MRWSRAFLPVLKESPADAQIVSHKLMLRAGLVRQTAAGIYAWLPLGFRVLKKIEQIVREEQDRSGALEMLMPTLQSAELWRESGRYDAYGPEMLRIRDRHEREMLYGPTNEEMITTLFRDEVKSYRDLPRTLYHIQWKFRDEVRPRFGVMRGPDRRRPQSRIHRARPDRRERGLLRRRLRRIRLASVGPPLRRRGRAAGSLRPREFDVRRDRRDP